MLYGYIFDLLSLLVAAVVIVPLAQWLRLGAVPGFLIAGGIVGPSGFGLITNTEEIHNFAEIGVVFLLFVIGIELKPSLLWRIRRLVFGLGSVQVIFTGLLLILASHLLFSINLKASILIGLALALSSTAFVLQLLTEKGSLTSKYGRSSFSILLLQDLAVVPLLVLVPLLTMPELSIGADIGLAILESLLIMAAVVAVGHYLLHPILHQIALTRNSEIFSATALLIVLSAALVTEYVGLSMAMGAFLAGLLLSGSSYKHQVMGEIHPLRGIFLGIFFMSMGMSLNLDLLLEVPVLSFSLVLLLISIKVIALYPITRFFGLRKNHGIAVSLLLAQSGEFALVLFSLAHQSQLFDNALFEQLLIIVLLSMLATPLLAHWAHRFARKESPKSEGATTDMEIPSGASIILVGFGRVGRRIGEILHTAGHSFIALDNDPSIVKNGRANGLPVYFGDIHNLGLLKMSGIHQMEAVVITLNNPKNTEEFVEFIRTSFPTIPIYARSHNLEQCIELRRIGASDVVSETIEASLELAKMALNKIGVEEEKQDLIINEYRQNYRAKTNQPSN